MTVGNIYYANVRQEMLEFVPIGTTRLLDIGCAEGRFAELVKEKLPDCETWGVEPLAEVAEKARTRLDHVISKTLQDAEELPRKYFDVVVMNDSLEHCEYSEPILHIVSSLLKENGRLILSIPNVRYHPVVRDLLFGNDWAYADSGVMDRTHFRFFTTKSAKRLLEENGFRVETLRGFNYPKPPFRYRLLFALAPKFFASMRHVQIAIVARPNIDRTAARSHRNDDMNSLEISS